MGKAEAAMNYKCPVCLQAMPSAKLLEQHYISKHPGQALPAVVQEALDAANAKKAPSGAAAEKPAATKPKKKKDADVSALLAEGLNKPGKKK